MSRPGRRGTSLSVWPPARVATAAGAIAMAVTTALAAAVLGGDALARATAMVYLGTALWAVADPRGIPSQVGAGVGLAWALLPGAGETVVAVVPVVVGVVATSELLGSAARLRMVLERDPAPEWRRAGLAVAAAAVTSTATLAAGALAGPSGVLATLVATAGCAALALTLRAPVTGTDGQR